MKQNPSHESFLMTISNEILDFLLIVIWVAVIWVIVMYHKAVTIRITDLSSFVLQEDQSQIVTEKAIYTVSSTSLKTVFIDEEEMEWLLWKITHVDTPTPELRLEDYLSTKIWAYDFAFNDLPPGRRLMMKSIWVDTPIVDVDYASEEKMKNGDFDDELRQWIVKYPFTAEPGEEWNWLLFWHSSVSAREDTKNPFGYVFYKLPKIQEWETFDVIRDGQMYSYEIEEKLIKDPTEVWEEIEKYDTKGSRNITLMACYPLFSDLNRILVRAKQLNKQEKKSWNIFSLS